MPEPLEAELQLDTSAAERAVEDLRREVEDQLQAAVEAFGREYASTVSDLPEIRPDLDADAVTAGITDAVDAADTTVTPTADAGGVTTGITDAVDAADTNVVATADAGAVTDGIERAVDDADAEVKVTADLGDVQRQLDDIANTDLSGVGGGFDAAADDASDFNQALSELDAQSGQTSDRLGVTSNVSTTLATAFSAAKGEGNQLVKQLAGMSGQFGPVIAGAAGTAAGFIALEHAGAKSIDALERVRTVLGSSADLIEHIDVGGLTGDLSDLAVQAGSSSSALRQAAANMAQLGLSSGASKRQVAEFANNVNALALRAVAMNPALGDAGAAAERLNLVLGRGGRFLNRYGISLTTAEITTRALADSGKSAAKDLTSFERSVAGAELATEKLGTQLGTDFQKGTEQTSVRVKALGAELRSAFAAAGKPLVEPTISALEELTGVATELSAVLGELGTAAIPLLAAGAKALGGLAGPARVLAEGLNALPGSVLTAGIAFLALRRGIEPLGGILRGAGLSLVNFIDTGSRLGTVTTAAGSGLRNLGIQLQNNSSALAGAASGAIIVAGAFDHMGDSLTGMLTGIAGATIAGEQLGAVLGQPVLGAAVGAGVGAILSLLQSTDDAGLGMDRFRENVHGVAVEIEKLGAVAGFKKFIHSTGIDINTLADDMRSATLSLDEFDKKIGNTGGTKAEVPFKRAQESAQRFKDDLLELAKKSPGAAQVVVDGAQQMTVAFGKAKGQVAFTADEIAHMQGIVDKGSAAFTRHAVQASLAADKNAELASAADDVAVSTVGSARAVEVADEKLRKFAESASGATNRATEFGKAVQAQITAKAPAISDAFDDITSAIQKFADNNSIQASVGDFSRALDEQQAKVRDWLATVHGLFDQGLTGLAALVLQRGPDAAGALAEQIRGSGPDQAQAWNDSILAGIQGAASAEQDAEQLGERISGKVAEGIKANPDDLIDAMKTKLASLVKFGAAIEILVKEGLTGLAGVLEGLGAEDGAAYADAIVSSTPATRAAWNLQVIETKKALDATQKGIDDAKPGIAASQGSVAQAMQAEWSAGLLPIPKTVDEAMLQAQAAITNAIPGVKGAATRAGFQTVGGIADGINAGAHNADEAARNLATGLTGVFEQIPADSYGIGTAAGDGLANGLRDSTGRVLTEAERLAVSALDALSHVYIIGSPSKATMKIGRQFDEGLAIGISTGKAVGAAADVGHQTIGALGAMTPHAQRAAAYRDAPVPPQWATPFRVAVDVSGAGGGSDDHSIRVEGGIHNYGPDQDVRGQAQIRTLRAAQWVYG